MLTEIDVRRTMQEKLNYDLGGEYLTHELAWLVHQTRIVSRAYGDDLSEARSRLFSTSGYSGTYDSRAVARASAVAPMLGQTRANRG